MPAPFPQAVGRGARGRTLLRLNVSLIALRPLLVACRSFAVRPSRGLSYLLRQAEAAAVGRANAAGANAAGATEP